MKTKDDKYGPAVCTLPDCMMPDGDSPCVGYTDLFKQAEMMTTTLYRIADMVPMPGNWTVTDWQSLDGLVAAVRQMRKAEVKLASIVNVKPEHEDRG